MYLESVGYIVGVADSVNSAIEFARTWKFDVLICDLNLRDGTGWDLVKRLSAKEPVRAIAFSGLGEAEHLAQSEAAGFIEHLVKGSPAEALVSAVENALKIDLKTLAREQSKCRSLTASPRRRCSGGVREERPRSVGSKPMARNRKRAVSSGGTD